MLNNFLNNYFGFNKQQRNGLLVLLSISFLLFAVRLAYPIFIKADNIVLLNLPLIEKKLDSAYASRPRFSKNNAQKQSGALTKLFVFDPNTVTREQLLLLGLKEKTVQIFLKFRDKGFVFKQKKDLRKVYGISEKLYTQLEPYILIGETTIKQPEKPKKQEVSEKSAVKIIPAKLELNSADSTELVALDGIGIVYARRILKYRTILGGFTNVEQLKEVYGFSEALFENVKNNFIVDARTLKKINLNKDDFKRLNKHPYLSYELTKSIFDWRRKTTITEDNLKDILDNPALYQKLLPYLNFD